MEDYPSVKLRALDKSTARTLTLEAKVGSTVTYGPLFIKVQSCRKAPPIEKPESAAFLHIWEVPPGEEKSSWSFSGWMYASSPALSAMDHPVYDVWVLDCVGKAPEEPPPAEEPVTETPAQDVPVAAENDVPQDTDVPLDTPLPDEPAAVQ